MAFGVRSLIGRAAKGTPWSHFLDYASPAFFEVMPARALFAQGKEFVANASSSERFAAVREQVSQSLRQREVDVELSSPGNRDPGASLSTLAESTRREMGHRILEIYFIQLLAGEHSILDLRSESFSSASGGALRWHPRAFYLRWEPAFLTGLRELYAGFYLDDQDRFESGLQALGLEGSGDVLLSHLGGNDQRNVRFDTRAFDSSFHETFLRCRERGVALHRNFVALGVYLVCLYDVLEFLAVPFDVRSAFEHAYGLQTEARG